MFRFVRFVAGRKGKGKQLKRCILRQDFNEFCPDMFKKVLQNKGLFLLVVLCIAIKLFSLNEAWVERYYTFGFYPFISGLLRLLFGWIPFSIGDLLYLAASAFLIVKVIKFFRLLFQKQLKAYISWKKISKYLKLLLWIYLVFNFFWGLNYNRQGIAKQFSLNVQSYNAADLYQLTFVLQQRLNFYAAQVDSVKRLELNQNKFLFSEAVDAYQNAARQYSFLTYRHPSVKPSMLTLIGKYFGFTGYYNPFSGEAQVKTDVPVFAKPFIVCHEIGHQLGYAKENEANFAGFLSGKASGDIEFRYSAYYEMYGYALRELFFYDFGCVLELNKTIHPQVKKDNRTYRQYLFKTQNIVEPLVSNLYDSYLKLNRQPKGTKTYNEVVAWLIAYMKKYGKEAI